MKSFMLKPAQSAETGVAIGSSVMMRRKLLSSLSLSGSGCWEALSGCWESLVATASPDFPDRVAGFFLGDCSGSADFFGLEDCFFGLGDCFGSADFFGLGDCSGSSDFFGLEDFFFFFGLGDCSGSSDFFGLEDFFFGLGDCFGLADFFGLGDCFFGLGDCFGSADCGSGLSCVSLLLLLGGVPGAGSAALLPPRPLPLLGSCSSFFCFFFSASICR